MFSLCTHLIYIVVGRKLFRYLHVVLRVHAIGHLLFHLHLLDAGYVLGDLQLGNQICLQICVRRAGQALHAQAARWHLVRLRYLLCVCATQLLITGKNIAYNYRYRTQTCMH